MQKHIFVLIALFIAVPAAAFQETAPGQSRDVRVLNFPETQNIEGSVAVKGLIKHSLLVRREKILIPPSQRNDTNSLTEAGVIQTDGFTSAILSILGEVKSKTFSPCSVGAILVPDEKPIIQAFSQDQTVLFPIEVTTEVLPEAYRYFSSEPTRKMVGFPRYRIFLYNSTNTSVEANLYIYLVN